MESLINCYPLYHEDCGLKLNIILHTRSVSATVSQVSPAETLKAIDVMEVL